MRNDPLVVQREVPAVYCLAAGCPWRGGTPMAAPAAVVADLTAEVPVARTLTVADLEGLVDELTAYHAHFAPCFARRDQRAWVELYLRGLLTADVPRKNIEAMALRLLGAGPAADRRVRALQYCLSEGAWEDEA